MKNEKKSIFSLGPNGPILQIFLVVQYLVGSLKMPSDGSNNLIFLDRVKEHCAQCCPECPVLVLVPNLSPDLFFLQQWHGARRKGGAGTGSSLKRTTGPTTHFFSTALQMSTFLRCLSSKKRKQTNSKALLIYTAFLLKYFIGVKSTHQIFYAKNGHEKNRKS